MNEPVRVGIVFPRSGQHVFVQVPRTLAISLDSRCAGLHTKGVVSIDRDKVNLTDVSERHARPL